MSPVPYSTESTSAALNKPLQTGMSEYVRRVKPTLREFVELLRGQTADDYRLNKAVIPGVLEQRCRGYQPLGALLGIAAEGVKVKLQKAMSRQSRFSRNHPSASRRLNVLRANIRKEQDLFRCIVVADDRIEIWPELFVSPFGVVDKGDGDPRTTGRVIHDLSYPEEGSVNLHTDQDSVPRASFEHCSSIAREVIRCQHEDPESDVLVMAGDVASPYRNAATHSECVHLFAGHIEEDDALVIDMSAAFGWTGSAGTYSVLGGAVAFVHGSTGDIAHPTRYYNYLWVDDHGNVAADVASRCAEIDISLRHAMVTVLGPAAVNIKKFTEWSTRQMVLGLIFDTAAATVSMPAAKIAKAQSLVAVASVGSTPPLCSAFRRLSFTYSISWCSFAI